MSTRTPTIGMATLRRFSTNAASWRSRYSRTVVRSGRSSLGNPRPDAFPTGRSNFSRPSPTRPSSRSKTYVRSTKYKLAVANSASHWSSRRRPRKCSASSAARRASWSRCSRPCWKKRSEFARPNLARCTCARATDSARSPCTTRHRHWPRSAGAVRSIPDPAHPLAVWLGRSRWPRLPTSRRCRITLTEIHLPSRPSNSADIGPCSPYRCLRSKS